MNQQNRNSIRHRGLWGRTDQVSDGLFRWFEGTTDPFPTQMPGKPPPRFWAFVRHYTWPYRYLIAACAFTSAIVASLEVYLFSYVGTLVDWLAEADRETVWETHGVSLALMALLVLLLIPGLKLLYELIVHQGLLGNFAMRNRWQAHRYVLRQSLGFFQDDFAGRVATKVMQSALALRDVVVTVVEVLLYVGFYFCGALLMIGSSDWRLSTPLLLWLLGYILTMRYFVPRLARVAMEQADARSVVTGRIVDSYTNIMTVKMFADARHEDAYAREGMQPFLDNVYEQMRLTTKLTFTLNCMNGMLLFAVAGLSIWLWSLNAVTTGAIAFSMGLILRLQGMAHWILWEVANLFENIGVVRDGINTIARDRLVMDRADAVSLVVKRGHIRFDNVTFDYGRPGADDLPPVIRDLMLDIKPGEKVGIVGRSGAGKSTLVGVLLRLYDLERGRILIDDQDVAAVRQDSLRSQIGMVTQDTSLLHRSVMQNILYGKPDASEADVVAAAERAQAHDFITRLEDGHGRRGYAAHVGERGVKLSGGQRQRIAIARVLLKDAPILVLDEATSALDSEVEAAIQEQLYNLMAGKTVIAIAHRLSTIAAMDRLIVMDGGRIVEQGAHDELLASGGLYAELWRRQSGGFIDSHNQSVA